MAWGNKIKRAKAETRSDYFANFHCFISKKLEEQLEQIAITKCCPKSRLIYIAVINELSRKKPFDFPSKLPDVTNVNPSHHVTECRKLMNFLSAFPQGLDGEMILLMHTEYDVSSIDKALTALAILVQEDLVAEFRPVKYKGRRPADYTRFRVVDATLGSVPSAIKRQNTDGENSFKGKHSVKDEHLIEERDDEDDID